MSVCADCGKWITDPEDTSLAAFALAELGDTLCDSCVRAYHDDLVVDFEIEEDLE